MKPIKYFAFLLIAAGIVTLIIDPTKGSEMLLLAGLVILFVTNGKKPDERSISLKTSSAYISLIISYSIKLISSNLYSHQIIRVQLTEINHFLILVFSMSVMIFYTRMYLNLD